MASPPPAPPGSSTGVSEAPPDADGNPDCPPAVAWGAAGDNIGIVVAYWARSADYSTVLVRTKTGHDVAQSITVGPDQWLQLFNFPHISPTVVQEVLVITNDKRCYARADTTGS